MPLARRYFFCAQCGVGTPAGYGISRGSPCGIGSKGANQGSHPAPLHTRRLQNAQSDPDQNRCDRQQKAPAGLAGARLNLIAGETPFGRDDQGFRGRKRLTLGSALRQADDACLTSPRHHEARMPTTNLYALLCAPAVVSVSRR